MKKTPLFHLTKVIFITGYYLLIAFPLVVSAAITLQWDANDPPPEGYNLYQREAGQGYNYSNPVNTEPISITSHPVDNLQPGVTYFFVVRAFVGTTVSADSNEAEYTEPATISDSDGDGVADGDDAFPNDPGEWLDTDNDGIGNNADTDDDDDGMPDSYELQIDGLDPLVDDADGDLDGDNVSNQDEYENGTDPTTQTNYMPDRPILSGPAHQATVSLTPHLTTQDFRDANGDSHLRTRYQIASDVDFTDLVFDRVYTEYLTDLPLMDLILDPEATYYWRVSFIDDQEGDSPWSAQSSFTTVDYLAAGDEDANGILDNQEVEDMTIDLDGNEVPDVAQSNLLCVATNDGINPHVAIGGSDSETVVVGLRALVSDDLGRAFSLNRPETLTGLISFKAFLDEGVTTALITVYFSAEAPENAAYYYNTEDGWMAYTDAVFSSDRRSVTITLEDGGDGDQDGIQNGVIVDPAGLGYSSQTYNSGSFGGSEETTCFIATPLADYDSMGTIGMVAMVFCFIACGSLRRVRRPRH